MEAPFIFAHSSYEWEAGKWKKSLKYYSLHDRKPLEIKTTP